MKPLIALIHFYLRTAEPSQTWQLLRFPCSDLLGLPTSASCTSLQSEPSSVAPTQPQMLQAALAGAGQPLPFLWSGWQHGPLRPAQHLQPRIKPLCHSFSRADR